MQFNVMQRTAKFAQYLVIVNILGKNCRYITQKGENLFYILNIKSKMLHNRPNYLGGF